MPAPLKLVESEPLSPARAALSTHFAAIKAAEKPVADLTATWDRLQQAKSGHLAAQAAAQAQKDKAVDAYRAWINAGCKGDTPAPALDTAEAAQAAAALEAIRLAETDLQAQRAAAEQALGRLMAATLTKVGAVLLEAAGPLIEEIEHDVVALRAKIAKAWGLKQALHNAELHDLGSSFPGVPSPDTAFASRGDVDEAALVWKGIGSLLGSGDLDAQWADE